MSTGELSNAQTEIKLIASPSCTTPNFWIVSWSPSRARFQQARVAVSTWQRYKVLIVTIAVFPYTLGSVVLVDLVWRQIIKGWPCSTWKRALLPDQRISIHSVLALSPANACKHWCIARKDRYQELVLRRTPRCAWYSSKLLLQPKLL